MTDYILEPLDTDTESIFQSFIEFVQSYYPDWNANEGQLDVLISRFYAMQVAFTADMASRVQRAIFRYFGSSLANIPPLPGAPAYATIAFTCPANEFDQLLPYGTMVGLTNIDGDVMMFTTLDDLVVPAHATEITASMDAQSIELTADANGLTGTVQLVEMVDWVTSAQVSGSSASGADPEEDDVYIQRLTTNLALMAPRPIVAQDFAMISQNVPGVWRTAAIDNFGPGTNEQQTITSNYTAGTFKLQFPDTSAPNTTSSIPAAATSAQVYAALSALPLVNDVDITVTGGPLPTTPIVVEFGGQYAYQNVPMMTSVSSLTSGSSFTITQSRASAAYNTTAKGAVAISSLDENGNPISKSVRDNLMTYLNSLLLQNFLLYYVEPTPNDIQVSAAGVSYPTAVAASVESIVETNIQTFLDPATWGQITVTTINRNWFPQRVVRYLDLTTAVENTQGYDYTTALTFKVGASAMDTTDKTMAGAFPIPRKPAAITVSITQG